MRSLKWPEMGRKPLLEVGQRLQSVLVFWVQLQCGPVLLASKILRSLLLVDHSEAVVNAGWRWSSLRGWTRKVGLESLFPAVEVLSRDCSGPSYLIESQELVRLRTQSLIEHGERFVKLFLVRVENGERCMNGGTVRVARYHLPQLSLDTSSVLQASAEIRGRH